MSSVSKSLKHSAQQQALFEQRLVKQAESGALGMEEGFEVPFVAQLALKEKQIQQNVRPVIAVHKWFARRPGTLFRSLLLSEFGEPPLSESFYRPHHFEGLVVADPFMGGGTPLLEANRLGCDVLGWDVNPMAYWVVRQEIQHLDLVAYEVAARRIEARIRKRVGELYVTRCLLCGADSSIKYFIWVKTRPCDACGTRIDLFPGYVLAHAGRHPRHVLVCAACGGLTEVGGLDQAADCRDCGETLRTAGPARRGRCRCPKCGQENAYPDSANGPPAHRMIAIEYVCFDCKTKHTGRFFKKPDDSDLARYARADKRLRRSSLQLVPDEAIPDGDETGRLHRWGYLFYRQMFNSRQLLGLELLAREIRTVSDAKVRGALATNLSDLLRYQNMLCRYDTRALKSLDIFSVHGYPVGLIQCESNLIGIQKPGTRVNVGSGGWLNIVEKFLRAKEYCAEPFELRYNGRRKSVVPISGEWIGDSRGDGDARRVVELRAESATKADLAPASVDAVLTDPPYYANVQYAELMDFCYVWLRRLVGEEPAFLAETTRNHEELTGNVTLNRGLEHFTEGLSEIYTRMAVGLKPGRPFAFTYHHNTVEAYYPIAVAMLDAGLACTAALPCPGEMGGSIHIHRTESSIVDTVFVCRSTGTIRKRTIVNDAAGVASLVAKDLGHLQAGGVKVTKGDARCVAFGHLIRLAVWELRAGWDISKPCSERLKTVAEAVAKFGGWEGVEEQLNPELVAQTVRELAVSRYGEQGGEISF